MLGTSSLHSFRGRTIASAYYLRCQSPESVCVNPRDGKEASSERLLCMSQTQDSLRPGYYPSSMLKMLGIRRDLRSSHQESLQVNPSPCLLASLTSRAVPEEEELVVRIQSLVTKSIVLHTAEALSHILIKHRLLRHPSHSRVRKPCHYSLVKEAMAIY